MDRERISDTTAGTVTVSQPPLVNSSVRDATGAITNAKRTDTYQGRADIHKSTGKRHTNAVIAIPTLPSTDFIHSIYLPLSVCFPIFFPTMAATASPGPQAIIAPIAM